MATNKTKRVAVVTALSASLVIGGAAAFAASDGPACVHGKGKGLGTGAPGNGKGQGAENGWPHGCQDHGRSDDDHGQSDDDHGHGNSGDQGGSGTTTPPPGDTTPPPPDGGGTQSGGDGGTTGNTQNVVDVQASVQVDLPEVNLPDPVAVAQDAGQTMIGILQPAAESVVGQAVETAGQAQDLARSDVAGIAGLLGTATDGATSLNPAALDAAVNASGGSTSGAVSLTGSTDGITSLAGTLLGQTMNIVGGTRTGLFGIVSGMSLPL